MSKIALNVPKELCAECSLALRRFIGGREGVDSIDVENGKIEINFDASKIVEGHFGQDLQRQRREARI